MTLQPKDHEYFEKNNIFFQDTKNVYPPMYDYLNDSRLPEFIVQKLKSLNYVTPTPIQAISIPSILEDNDFIGNFALYWRFDYIPPHFRPFGKRFTRIQVSVRLVREKLWPFWSRPLSTCTVPAVRTSTRREPCHLWWWSSLPPVSWPSKSTMWFPNFESATRYAYTVAHPANHRSMPSRTRSPQ